MTAVANKTHRQVTTKGACPVLSVRELRLSLSSGKQYRTVLEGIDLDIHAGEIVGLVGESGSGKSLTANALMGLLPAHGARLDATTFVLGDEQDLSSLDEKRWRSMRGRDLAMIFQEPQLALDPVFTVGQQLFGVIRRHLKVGRKEAFRIASDTLFDCGLTDTDRILSSYPHEISGGMRQRVMIAMALSCQPKLLIADEPTSALDISSRDQVLALLFQAARKRNTAVLFISHDLAAIARICDRTLVMYSGRVVESGDTAQLLGQPRHPYTAALLAATPKINVDGPVPVRPIPGTVNPRLSLPSACSFANRCKFASELCSKQLPVLQGQDDSPGKVACHHPLAGSAT